MKARFGREATEKIVRFRTMHTEAYRQVITEAQIPGLLESCQFRDVEAIEASVHPQTWESRKKQFNAWRADMPTEAAEWSLYEGQEAIQVRSFLV